jgi:MAF protein
MSMKSLVLASSSPHRRMLLDRLQLPYTAWSPDIDETRRPEEAASDYVARLSQEKAFAAAGRFPDALIIGSDQAAVWGDAVLGKPKTAERAASQLRQASGQKVEFLTGLTLLNAASGRAQTEVVPFRVHFRQLSDHTIARYIQAERPLDCAGSFKSEGLGIALFERMEGDDPSALIGLPLIRLVTMLAAEGLEIP